MDINNINEMAGAESTVLGLIRPVRARLAIGNLITAQMVYS